MILKRLADEFNLPNRDIVGSILGQVVVDYGASATKPSLEETRKSSSVDCWIRRQGCSLISLSR